MSYLLDLYPQRMCDREDFPMSVEQMLVGPMGCASWRSHFWLREHAKLAPVARVIRGSEH